MRVSRAALDDSSDGGPDQESDDEEEGSENEEGDSEEYDDPDTADLERDNIIDDEEIDSDEAFADGEEDMFKKKGFTFKDSKAVTNGRSRRPVAADFMSGSESEEEGPEVDDDSDEGQGAQLYESGSDDGASDGDDGDDGDDSSAEEDSDDASDEGEESDDEDDEMGDEDHRRSDIGKFMKGEQKTVVGAISQAAKEDAKKGVAVRKQRRTYDSLLNLRIRLQKGLVAINSLGEAADGDDADKEPYEGAEEAAIKLWNAIDGFRTSLLPEQKAGQKRKREVDPSTPTEALWDDMQATEEQAAAKRKKVLEKWSARVKTTTATVGKERQLSAAATQGLVSVLEGQLLNSDRLVKRTHVPRSCAPVQAERKVVEDPSIYDDADFYQLLLKELVDQRSNDAGAGASGNGDVPTVRWMAIKEAKTRKQVDRRASKGRKLRFTVHEKLQNFMAPEDRRVWEDEAIDRLFGTLFGQRMQLKEDVEEEEDDEDDDMAAAEEGLKLFRS